MQVVQEQRGYCLPSPASPSRISALRAKIWQLCEQVIPLDMHTQAYISLSCAVHTAGELPFGQLPILIVGDKVIAQSGAIVRYAAKIACTITLRLYANVRV
jgi:hypothetical protein